LVWSCRVVSKFHYTHPQTLSATRSDPRTKSVHVEIEKSLRPDKVRGLCRRPGRRPGSPTKSGRARLVEFGHKQSYEKVMLSKCRYLSEVAVFNLSTVILHNTFKTTALLVDSAANETS